MGNFISWLNKNLAPDENQGSARETQPQSAWGELCFRYRIDETFSWMAD